MRFYVQFTAGMGELVRRALEAQLGRVRIRYVDDSAMVIESTASASKVGASPVVKNAFVVIAETRRGDLDRSVLQLARIVARQEFPKLPGESGRFRVMVHVDGPLAPVSARARSALEQAITAGTGARVEPRGSCQEYWVVGRDEMRSLLLCARLPKKRKPGKPKGAVSYELSAMLVFASNPTPQDVFLDPFAGSGSFASARLELPVRQVWCSDIALKQHRRDWPRQLTSDGRVRLLAEDALTLPSIPDGSVDVIVTDPPWGEYEDIGQPYERFARGVGTSFARVLHPRRWRYVLLVSRRNAQTMSAGLSAAGLPPHDVYEILVNGHPASVLLGSRHRGSFARQASTSSAGVGNPAP